jgi:hypothetical protein
MKSGKAGRRVSLHTKRGVTPNESSSATAKARRDGCAGEGGGAAGVTRRSGSLQRLVRRVRGIGIYRRRLPLSGELAECQ